MTPRGIRNDNPGNIRHGDDWQGMRARQTDAEYVQFVSPAYGIRAMTRILRTYRTRHGITTINDILHRWAPPSENDTAAYVASVVDRTGIPSHLSIGEGELPLLIDAIIYHENGQQPYDVATIAHGIALA